jgi:peptide/histidine transporter 3/4
VSQVEELKMLLRLLPVWASMVLFFAVSAQMVSTFIEQARVMDNRVGPFTIPPASIATFDVISVMVCIPVYDAVLVPLARGATGNDHGLSQLHRLAIGLALSVVVMVYAALLEGRRLALARANMPAMNIVWQAPTFAVHGAGAVFATVGVLEFFYDQSPDGMKSLGNALALLSMAAGSYFNSAALGAVAATAMAVASPSTTPRHLTWPSSLCHGGRSFSRHAASLHAHPPTLLGPWLGCCASSVTATPLFDIRSSVHGLHRLAFSCRRV